MSIVPFSVDVATYVGDGNDGCYYQVAEDKHNSWYVTVVVDSNTGSFVDTLYRDDGPYRTREDAEIKGHEAAIDWCLTNHVNYDDDDEVQTHEAECANCRTIVPFGPDGQPLEHTDGKTGRTCG